ncbi:SH3 domain-containing kinase-binding protein 1 isoform X2 [Copidosoma floridanum]|nr:SH3 domain-containing kinase-binding protein 1 isoform X2 [Copidosoma floridanum]XP_014205682.1 SH3 domain-containing kinase-binding protein 1 isoform X2 [Copidosoma floridanum]XP_014205683.1 SH3 domain-containing kinase-binding protein 1 isoform X2 [Copidosoma floridanum]
MEALVEYNYEAQEPDELTIRKGDIIKDIKVTIGGWWEGTLRDKRGMFPDNFVKVLDPQEAARNNAGSDKSATMKHDGEVTLRNGSERRVCRVMFSYEPCNDDELKLIPDDSIEYLGEVEEGWWRGKLKGRIGVFPSNFVSSPEITDETDKSKDKKEYCRVLYPYEAANEDELTIAEGDVITLMSRDAPDKGWWKGELKGQVGLFPDNFVEVITVKNEQFTDGPMNQMSIPKSLVKHQIGKKKETANIRKSLEVKNQRSDNIVKKSSAFASSSSLSVSSVTTDKKTSNTSVSSLKRLVVDNSNVSHNNGNAGTELGEELDEVERGEGGPLSHLTASRAKAPRRRLPSAQHLRHNVTTPTAPAGANNIAAMDNMTNGNADVMEQTVKDDENDGLLVKLKKAPWMEELKLNQIERKKGNTEKSDKGETKKDRVFSWLTSPANNSEAFPKQDLDGDDHKPKEKERDKEKSHKTEPTPSSEQPSPSPATSMPAYIPYHLYAPLLDRIAVLEEKQTILQRKVNQLSEQLAAYVGNGASDKD